MPIAAVPGYINQNSLGDASPGLRFGMYLKLWGVDSRSTERLWETHDIIYRTAGQEQRERQYKSDNKAGALKGATALTPGDKALAEALNARQVRLSGGFAASSLLRCEAVAVSPFSTGLGNEHPLENGFSFLNPYGMPYLPGSGVKGVMRQAARELARGEWDSTFGWNKDKEFSVACKDGEIPLSMIDVLFGREDGDGDQCRGALTFWDVIPRIDGERLQIEVMTPHQSDYHQGVTGPNESGQPIPITFLAVPPGSAFAFNIGCDLPMLGRLAPGLVDCWQSLICATLQHAFDWLGFGAKTAVGYGAMRDDPQVADRRRREAADEAERIEGERQRREREQELAAMSPVDRAIAECLYQRADQNQPEIAALCAALRSGRWTGEEKREVARIIKRRMDDDKVWREMSNKKNPARDKNYQNTLLVMSAINGE
jgi:CRISPR-associated protein Cmr6